MAQNSAPVEKMAEYSVPAEYSVEEKTEYSVPAGG